MELSRIILELAANTKVFGSKNVLQIVHNQYTRQYVAKILNQLVREGKLTKTGTTRKSLYSLPQNVLFASPQISLTLPNRQLQEDEVLSKLKFRLPFLTKLPENITKLFDYAFLEMLNNAIEHSQSDQISVRVFSNPQNIGFEIIDQGVGVFYNVKNKLGLSSELDAVQDILKGKATTSPVYHSGEGLFFTSKTADIFTIESHTTRLKIDNIITDVFIEPLPQDKKGTVIYWNLSLNSGLNLTDIFAKFQSVPDTFQFDQTQILVRLYTLQTDYISRSQARRLLAGLDKFKVVILDFDRVKTVGQGFADEVFRVFTHHHPNIQIKYQNASKEVETMIKHVSAMFG